MRILVPSRPRVLITMGTVVPWLGGVGLVRDLIDAVVATAADTFAEPMEILVALGSDPAELGTLPESVRAYRGLRWPLRYPAVRS